MSEFTPAEEAFILALEQAAESETGCTCEVYAAKRGQIHEQGDPVPIAAECETHGHLREVVSAKIVRDDVRANIWAELAREGMPERCWSCQGRHFELAGPYGYICAECGEPQGDR